MRHFGTSRLSCTVAAAIAMALAGAAAAAAADYVTFAGWGGVTQKAERDAYFVPAEKALGITIREDRHGGFAGFKAHVLSGNVTWDIVGTGFAECERAVQNDMVQKLDYGLIDTKDLDRSFVNPYYVGLWTFSYGIAYNTKKYGANPPQSWADFWDAKKFPGKRSLWGAGRYVLEAALMADGVAPNKVYDALAAPGGVDRAFKKLEEVKPHVSVWWTSQGQAMQLIRDGEVDMILIANGRTGELIKDGAPVAFQFNQAMLDIECFLVPKGAPNAQLAMKVINESLKPAPQAAFTSYIEYGPSNPKAYETGLITPQISAKLPTAPDNLKKQGIVSASWYASKAGEDSLARLARFLQN